MLEFTGMMGPALKVLQERNCHAWGGGRGGYTDVSAMRLSA